MKIHWTIGKKLNLAFLAVTVIVLLLGLSGYYGAVKSNQSIEEIGMMRMPSVESLLIISEAQTAVDSAENALLSASLESSARQEHHQRIVNAKKRADDAWNIYEPLPHTAEETATWKEFVPAWEKWWKDHEEYVAETRKFEAVGIPDPTALARDLFEVRGTYWKTISSLSKQVKEGVALAETDTVNTLLVATATDWTKKISTLNPQIQASLHEIKPLNATLLASVNKVQELHAKGEQTTARQLFEKDLVTNAMKIIELMRPMRAEVDKAMVLHAKMTHMALVTMAVSFTAAETQLNKLVKINMKEAAQTSQASVSQAVLIKTLTLVAMSIGVVLAIGLGLLISRNINKALRKISESLSAGADQTSSAASQVSSASQSLAEGASEQAASLEETSSSLEEMSSMTKRNAESAKQAKDLANTTKSAAEAGSQCVQSMSQSMDRIQGSSNELRQAMGAVKESNNEVAKIIKTIDEIAFQTNILALNAAVEAARAGEAGLGFAVVADEVRNLAQKSAAAARETAEKIEASIGRTEAGVRVSEKVVDDLKTVLEQSRQVESSLKGIEQKSKEVNGLVGEIAAASLEQSQGIEQVNTAVNQMDKVTQSNAVTLRNTA